jgi:Fe-S cluster assembly iron-binding protein IscA
MALDESRDGDEIFNQNGLTFMIEKALLEDVKPIKVDFVETPRGAGYAITSNLQKGDGCGICGGSCD